MPLTLLAGPINSGKTRNLMDRLANSSPDGMIYIVPSDQTALILARMAMVEGKGALIDDIFLSWDRFVTNLANPRRPQLSGLELALFIQGIMVDHPMRYFKSKHPTIGLASQFADVIVALKKNGVDESRLRKILETRGSLKENDLLTIFERYELERKKLNLLDDGDLATLALAAIESKKGSTLEGVKTLLIDEFHRINPGQLIILNALKSSSPNLEIIITAPVSDNENSTYANYLNSNFSEISKIADEVITLTAKECKGPSIVRASSPSMLQEARAVVDLIEESDNNDIVLVTRSGDSFLDQFLVEAKNRGMLLAPLTDSSAMNAPIIHEMLSPEATEEWPPTATIEEYVDICRNFIRGNNRIPEWTKDLRSSEDRKDLISRSLSAISGLEQLLYKLKTTVAITGIERVSKQTFIHLIEVELSGHIATKGTLDNLLPCGHLSIESSMAVRASQLFLPRMIEGTIPRVQTERLFFADIDRLASEPDTTLDAIFPNAEEALAQETYLFETYVAKCDDKITFTLPSVDNSGKELSPSSFLDGIEEEYFISPSPAKSSVKNLPDWENLLGDGTLGDKTSREMVKKRFTESAFSATSLQGYAECPFVFFAEKVLGLKARDDETPDLLPKDRGTILHSILERFYKEEFDLFRKALIDDSLIKKIEDVLDGVLDEVMMEHAELVGRSAQGLRPFQKQSMKVMAMQVIGMELSEKRELDTPLFPMAFEWGFGTTPENALMIPVEGDKPAKLKGFIDRVDSNDDKTQFIVVDYKTGQNVESVKNKMLKGLHMQLPIYVEAVSRFLLPEAKAIGGVLLAVMLSEKKHGFLLKEYNGACYKIGNRVATVMTDEKWSEAYSSALGAIAVHVGSIRDGKFKADPVSKCPTYCNFSDVCRYSGEK